MKRVVWFIPILIFITLVPFWQVCHFEFVNYDDNVYIMKNPFIQKGLTAEGLKWAFMADLTEISPLIDYWQPVTTISRMVDIQLFGLKAAGHHLTNVLIHTLNVLLLFFLLFQITGRRWESVFAATLFSIHPLQVEPVVWVMARKDVLSVFFALLTLRAYVSFRQKRSRSRYWSILIFFAFSLMSKPTLAVLPLLMLLIDCWKGSTVDAREKEHRKNIFSEITPLFLMAAGFALTPFIGQPRSLSYATPAVMFSKVFLSYLDYLWLFFCPTRLGLHSHLLNYDFPLWRIFLALAVFSLMSFLAVQFRKRMPHIFFGWFWFLVALLPVVGLNMMADRFMYFPLIGLSVAVTWTLSAFLIKCDVKRLTVGAFAGALVCFLMSLSFYQAKYWKNSVSLFDRALEIDERNPLVHNNYGLVLLEQGRTEDAERHFQRVLELDPHYAIVYNNMGLIFLNFRKMPGEALPYFFRAIELDPSLTQVYFNIASAYAEEGDSEQAVHYFNRGIRLNSRHPGHIRTALAQILFAKGILRSSNQDVALEGAAGSE